MFKKYLKNLGCAALLSVLSACNIDWDVPKDYYFATRVSGNVAKEEHPTGPKGIYKIHLTGMKVDGQNRQTSKPIIIDGSDPNSNYYEKAEKKDEKIDIGNWVEFGVEERPNNFYAKRQWIHVYKKRKK